MFLTTKPQRLAIISAAVLLAGLIISLNATQAYDLKVRVDSTVGWPNQQDISIPVYMENYTDSVIAFEMWFVLEQPDILQLDEIIDTTGTLISGWNTIITYYLGDNPYNLVVKGLSNSTPPYTRAIEYPQAGDIPLFKLKADIYDIPDTVTDSTVFIYIVDQMLDYFCFTNPQTQCIGINTTEVVDTDYFDCMIWYEDVCLAWEQIPGLPADSTDIDTFLVATLDTTRVNIKDGSLAVLLCGDCNADKAINIIDIVDLINYKFKQNPPPERLESADVNHDGVINILDILYMIEFKFNDGPAPQCYE